MNLSDVFDNHFQKTFVAYLLRDSYFAAEVLGDFDPELFEDETLQIISRIGKAFYDEFAAVPGELFFGHIDRLKSVGDITDATYQAIASVWPDMMAMTLSNRQYLLSRYDQFLRHLQYRQAIPEALEQVKQGKFDDAEAALHKLITYRPKKKLDLGRFYDENVDARIRRRATEDNDRFWTLIPELDMRVDGGKRGELCVFQSQRSSIGKSAALGFLARSFLMQERNVLIVTLEMSEESYEDRLDMTFAAVTKDELDNASRIASRVKTVMSRGGRLKIKQFPSGRASLRDLENFVKTVEAVENFRPDVLILDYADLLQATGAGRESSYERGKQIYTDLRGWMEESNMLCWTAMQSGRSAMQAAVADQEHAAESIAKINIADIVLSINRTKEEEEQRITRLHVVKARNDKARYDIVFKTDFSRMQFWSQDMQE